ncbi:MAG: transposase, partial [Phycisphaerae bacterium]
EHAAECELVLLPGYAPEFNPDELLNQDLKSNVFSSGRPRTRDELIAQPGYHRRHAPRTRGPHPRPDAIRTKSKNPRFFT